MMKKKYNHCKLLWTGGWDSTYQLLKMIFYNNVKVIPFYIIDEDRQSSFVELLTMRCIKNKIINSYPEKANLISETSLFLKSDIRNDAHINYAFSKIRKKNYIGSQYEWIAQFCFQKNISDLHLCIHQDDKARIILTDKVVKDASNNYRVDNKYSDTNEYTLFKYFTFPIFDLTKKEMIFDLNHDEYNKIMNLTWFCHNPQKNMKPCGVCNACLYTIEEGLGYRISFYNRIRSYVLKKIKR